MKNTDDTPLVCIVVGQRLAHDVGDYPDKGKHIYRNAGLRWDVACKHYSQTNDGIYAIEYGLTLLSRFLLLAP